MHLADADWEDDAGQDCLQHKSLNRLMSAMGVQRTYAVFLLSLEYRQYRLLSRNWICQSRPDIVDAASAA